MLNNRKQFKISYSFNSVFKTIFLTVFFHQVGLQILRFFFFFFQKSAFEYTLIATLYFFCLHRPLRQGGRRVGVN